MATAVSTVVCRDPSVSVLEEHDHSIPNNRGNTVRTGLPPFPYVASTLQWQQRLFQVFGYSHPRGRDDPCSGDLSSGDPGRYSTGPSLQELNPAFVSAR
ncbi:hypothetical protein N7497_008431 [Penicillium chrysogenum]|nr:hypothetical protein N7497_008431 [Penicillium chrysogenum]